jgi:hypothetical protein
MFRPISGSITFVLHIRFGERTMNEKTGCTAAGFCNQAAV